MWDDYEMIFYFFNCFSIKQPFPDYGMEFCMDKKKKRQTTKLVKGMCKVNMKVSYEKHKCIVKPV